MNCFRYLDFKSFEEVNNLTIEEYNLLMKAVQLREVDKDYRNHFQAFLNFMVRAEKKSGKKIKPVYTNFEKFYNYKKHVNDVLYPDKKDKNKGKLQRLGEMLSRKEKADGKL